MAAEERSQRASSAFLQGCSTSALRPKRRAVDTALVQPKRDSPGYRKFVQALAAMADLVDVRVGRAGFLEQQVTADGALEVTYRREGEVIRVPRVHAQRLAAAGMAVIVQ